MDNYNQRIIEKFPKLVKVSELFDRFFHSNIYLILVCLIAGTGYLFEQQIPVMFVLLGFISLNLVACRDISPSFITTILIALTPVAFAAQDLSGFLIMTYATIFFVPAVILRFVFFPIRRIRGKNLIPILIYSITLCLGGIGSELTLENYLEFIPLYTTLGLGFLQLLLYIFWLNYTPAGSDKTINYFAKMMNVLAFVSILMVVLAFTVLRDDYPNQGSYYVYLPWKNYISLLLLLTMPFTFYFATKSNLPIAHMAFGVMQYFAIVITRCAGGIVFGTAILPLLFLYTIIKCKKSQRLTVVLGTLILVGVLIAVAVLKIDVILELYNQKSSSGGSGRLKIYKHAIEVFVQWPIFGGGMGIKDAFTDELLSDALPMMYYHSTFFQAIGSTGIVGLIGYTIMAFMRMKTYVKKKVFNIFLTIGFLGFAGYSMIDSGTVMPMPFCAILTFMLVLTEKYNAYNQEQLEMQQLPKAS